MAADVDPPPLPALLSRVRGELAASFDADRPLRLARAAAGAASAAVCLQARSDGQVQVFSFNRLDDHRPFQLRVPLARLRTADWADLTRELADPGRSWARPALTAIRVLAEAGEGFPEPAGLNIATLTTGEEMAIAEAAAILAALRAEFAASAEPPSETLLAVLSRIRADDAGRGESALREAAESVTVLVREEPAGRGAPAP